MKQYQITAERKAGAPGVYVSGNKIAALGLRISNGRCYHGLSINVDMDLLPFEWIKVCGMENLSVTQMSDHCNSLDFNAIQNEFTDNIKLLF